MNLTESIKFINDDCMNVMRDYPDNYFDLAIVDPPYRDNNQPNQWIRQNGKMDKIIGRPNKEYWNELKRISKEQIIWGANNFQLPQFKGFVVWDKCIAQDFNMSSAEIASLSDGLATISKIFTLRASGAEKRIHETQKPIKLYEWLLVNYENEGDRILDTHLGSGSHAIAAHYFGVKEFVGIELDKDYFDASVKRFKNQTAQVNIFQEIERKEVEQTKLL